MYFFLGSFSLLQIAFTSVCILRFLVTIVTGHRTISFSNYFTQLFIIILGVTKFFLLAAMSYDCYIANCRLQQYTSVVFPPVIVLLHHDFCSSNNINHFICDSSPMLQFSCSNTRFLELMAFPLALERLLITLALVTASYTAIVRAILKERCAQHRRKDFSTYSSHMVVVSITYGSCILMFIKPCARYMVELTKGLAVLNTSIPPMLNTFIYTLPNEQVKQAFMALVHGIGFSPGK
ncbi:olfactory receptor 6C75-like [Tachyglossus aculeatus]|uniref:olfactory receptor 6C75-like n=1 Tax=Tachyglossus aculeatus TaxID=9261 RepID=UPI0018F51344|nr:olfactory receptor 6C75-like [Tachyglossus aculeatus]